MEYRWMWYYLRRDTEYEICNICNMRYKSLHCSQMLMHLIKRHHLTILENNFTLTQNYDVKCNHCPTIYMASIYPCDDIQKHLTNKHNLNKDIANKLKIWVNQKLIIIEKCETCEQFEELDIFNLMVHLHRIHDVTVPPEFIPTGLKNCTWMWYYLRRDTEYEICNICNMRYKSLHCSQMLMHLIKRHHLTILENNFTLTQNYDVKCNHCPTIYMASIYPCDDIQKHLTNKHNLNKDIADKLKIWVNDQLSLIEKCETCNQFKKSDIFNKMVHLVEAHRVIVLPKFIPTGTLSPRLFNLFHRVRNTADIPTSNSNQQSTCSTLRTYVENFCSNLNSDRTGESIEKDIATSSTSQSQLRTDLAPSQDPSRDLYLSFSREMEELPPYYGEKSFSMFLSDE